MDHPDYNKEITVVCIKDHPEFEFKANEKYQCIVRNNLRIPLFMVFENGAVFPYAFHSKKLPPVEAFVNYFEPLDIQRKRKISSILNELDNRSWLQKIIDKIF